MAVTWLPGTLAGVADGAGMPAVAGPIPAVLEVPVLELPVLEVPVLEVPVTEGEACAWVAALTRSPWLICFSIPAGAAA